ncbi:MAG: hypothetical protein KR126chlam2_00135 [Chlamydiae bacterium]|nr:hypothetical protein [Chlamydiota bacterium]
MSAAAATRKLEFSGQAQNVRELFDLKSVNAINNGSLARAGMAHFLGNQCRNHSDISQEMRATIRSTGETFWDLSIRAIELEKQISEIATRVTASQTFSSVPKNLARTLSTRNDLVREYRAANAVLSSLVVLTLPSKDSECERRFSTLSSQPIP